MSLGFYFTPRLFIYSLFNMGDNERNVIIDVNTFHNSIHFRLLI